MRRAVASSATTLARRAYRAEASPADRARALALSAPLGFVAGAFGACVGVGGGALIAPVVASAAKTVPQRVVSGTSLVAVVGTASASAGTFAREGLTDYAAAALLGGAATLSAPLGARMTARMDCAALRRTLAWFLAGAAPMVPLKAVAFRARESGEGGKEKFDAAASAPALDGGGRDGGIGERAARDRRWDAGDAAAGAGVAVAASRGARDVVVGDASAVRRRARDAL